MKRRELKMDKENLLLDNFKENKSVETQANFRFKSKGFEFECSEEENNKSTFVCSQYSKESSTQSEHQLFSTKETQTEKEEEPGKFNEKNIRNSEDLKSVCGVSESFFLVLSDMLGLSVKDGRLMSKTEKLILFLMKLKHNLSFQFMSVLFQISRQTVSDIFNQVLDAIYETVKKWIWWLPKKHVQATMPNSFKESYPNCRAIIDASEVKCEAPSSVESQVLMYSNYKSSFTMKFLIAIAPNGLITFLSKAYGGRVTDCHLTADSGFLDLLEPGDEILADKGFPSIVESAREKGAFVCMPPFKRGDRQFSNSENEKGYKCASVRIHVERAIARMKYFKILKYLDHSLLAKIDKILICVAFICNNFPDLIQTNY